MNWKCFSLLLHHGLDRSSNSYDRKFWTALGILSRTTSVVCKTNGVRNIGVGCTGWCAEGRNVNTEDIHVLVIGVFFFFPLVVDRDKMNSLYTSNIDFFKMGATVALWFIHFFFRPVCYISVARSKENI